MIIQPRTPSGDASENELLYNLALSQGGALGDAAANLRDPKTSFFRDFGGMAKNAFVKVADALQTPLNMVAGLMDPNTTIREAMEKNITPGDILLEKPLKSDSFFDKTKFFVGKFALDTLLDPLTYVTFGASRGIAGLRTGQEAFAGAKLAQEMSLKEGTRVYLSQAGEDAATKLLQAKRQGLQHTYLLNERIKLVNRGLSEVDVNARMREVESTMSDFLTKETFGDTLDAGRAAQTIANIAGAKPHLMKKFIDQGGVKFFGQTMLQGQKIRAAAAAVPGMTLLDRAVEPVRKLIGNTFSVNYQNGIRMTDQYMADEQKWRNVYESSRHELVRNATNLKKQLGLSNEEWEFVTAAVENKLRPADPRGADLWNVLHKIPPENGTIPDRVWQGLIGVNRLNKLSLKRYRDAGLRIRNQEGYMPHILRETEAGVSVFAPRIPALKTDRERFAAVSTLVDKDGNRIPGQLDIKTGKFTFKLNEKQLADINNLDGINQQIAKLITGVDAAKGTGIMKLTQDPEDATKFIDESGQILKRVRAQVTEAKELGFNFEDNALAVSMINSADAIKVASTKEFMDDLVRHFGMPESQAPDGYVVIDKVGTKFEGQDLASRLVVGQGDNMGERLMFPPEIAERVTQFTNSLNGGDAATQAWQKAYDGLQNYIKAAVTAIFPAFHGRNAISNVFLMYNTIGAEALNPVNHALTSNIMNLEIQAARLGKKIAAGTAEPKELADLYTRQVFTDKTGYNWTWGELRSVIHKNLVAFEPKNLGFIDNQNFNQDLIAETAERIAPTTKKQEVLNKLRPINPLSQDNALFSFGFGVGRTIEDYSRTLAFIANIRKTGDPQQAARLTKLALFDYSSLTKFERNFLRRIIPFYTFSRKNIELQVKTLFTNPGRIGQQIRAMQTLGEAMGGEQLTEEQLAVLPEWARRGYNVVIGQEGSHVRLLNSLGTPLEEAFSRGNADANLGIISPLVKVPLELLTGYNMFYGRPISELTNADAYQYAPEFVQDFIGYEKVTYTNPRTGQTDVLHTSFAPWNMNLMNSFPPAGRFWNEVKRLEESPSSSAQLRALFLGVATREFDLEQEEQRRILEERRRLEELLSQARIGYQFTRYVQPTNQ